MQTRKTAFTRALEYFRTADVAEAAAAINAGMKILAERQQTPVATPVKRRKRRLNGPDVISPDNSLTQGATA